MSQLSCSDHYLPFSSSERDAVDVENATDYCEMVANLAKSGPDKIKILMDIKTIRSSCGRVVSSLKYRVWNLFDLHNRVMPAMMKITCRPMKMKMRYCKPME
jgi:hypothetical protein